MIWEWRGYIQKREDGSERVNYDAPHFPTYIYNGTVYTGATWEKDAHFHDDIEMIYLQENDIEYSINGETVRLHPGDCIFVNAKQVHYSIGLKPKEEKSHYIIYIFHPEILCTSPEVVKKYIKPITENSRIEYIIFRKEDRDTEKLSQIMEFLPSVKDNEFEITRLTFEIWKLITERCHDALISGRKPADTQSIEKFKKMTTFIQNNFSRQITLDDIADSGNVSRTYCNHLFHRFTSLTPIENLIRFRLYAVADLLVETDKPMTEIADLTGFASASYMTEKFRECYGMTPREHRKKSSISAEK